MTCFANANRKKESYTNPHIIIERVYSDFPMPAHAQTLHIITRVSHDIHLNKHILARGQKSNYLAI